MLLDGGVLNSECNDDTPDAELPANVRVESMSGDFHEAMRHLQHRFIDIPRPEEVRGGGLLKVSELEYRINSRVT